MLEYCYARTREKGAEEIPLMMQAIVAGMVV